MTCKMVSMKEKIQGPDLKWILTAKGQCDSRCLIYHAKCIHCDKPYVGKTIQKLSERVNGHRGMFYACLNYEGDRIDLDDDDHVLGLHLFLAHKIRDRRGFNGSFKFTIIELCNPSNIDLKEHLWIQRLKTIRPYGLNSHDPFGFPLVL